MRKIDTIIIHCSASREGLDLTARDIKIMHVKNNGWSDIGYHYVIKLDGTVEKGRPDSIIGAHAKGYNGKSIGICYIGGLDSNGIEKDTRTLEQKNAILTLLTELIGKYPILKIIGHRDISPDINKNGKVDPWERIKSCPCFDAIDEYKYLIDEKEVD